METDSRNHSHSRHFIVIEAIFSVTEPPQHQALRGRTAAWTALSLPATTKSLAEGVGLDGSLGGWRVIFSTDITGRMVASRSMLEESPGSTGHTAR